MSAHSPQTLPTVLLPSSTTTTSKAAHVAPSNEAVQFHAALWRGDDATSRALLVKHAHDAKALLSSELPAPHGRLRKPLMVSADNGHAHIAALLLEHGCSVNEANSLGVTALFVAAQEGREKIVELLIDHGASVHAARSGDAATPVLLAAQHGHDGCVAQLLAAGASVNVTTTDCGVTPLYTATFMHQVSTVKLLVAAGCNLNAKTTGDTPTKPLYLAAWKDFRDIGRILVASGATLTETERAALQVGMRPDVYNAWRTILDGTAITAAERAEVSDAIEAQRVTLHKAAVRHQWRTLRPRLFELCVGLESMDLPALVTHAIFEQFDEQAPIVPMHKPWAVITGVKHLLKDEVKQLRRS